MDKRVDRSSYEEELKSRDIIKVTEAEIFAAAQSLGNDIAEQSQKTLAGNLQKAIQGGGISGAIQYCNLKASPLTDSLQDNFQVEIKRVSNQIRNPKNRPDSLERQIFEAYQYNKSIGRPMEENIQALEEEVLLYNKPIVISNPLCLQCHGQVGQTLSEENHKIIKNLYPGDSAINYQMGDLRGMWSIRIPKKVAINQTIQ